MKKILYYVSPFIVFSLIVLADTLLRKIDIIYNVYDVVSVFLYVVIFLSPALIGSLSRTNKKFDYLITVLIPISFFLILFVGLFFDEGCDGKPQLSLYHALNMEYYKVWLPSVAIMTAVTFICSFKPIRISKKLWRIDSK